MRAIWLLTGKDLRTLVRSRVLLVLLLGYPLIIALLLGTLLLSATQSATIALVDNDRSGDELSVGEASFGLEKYRKQAEDAGVTIVDMDEDEAMHALGEGQVMGVLIIPERFFARLSTLLSPAELEFHTGDNALGEMIAQRVRGSVYGINLEISNQFVRANAEYLETLVEGGDVRIGDQHFDVLGLQPAVERLESARDEVEDDDARDDIDDVITFATDAQTGLDLADDALKAVAAPVRLEHVQNEGKSPRLTSRALSFALAVSMAFICVILVAASLAAERDEHVMGRLLRGIAKGWQVVASKLLLGVALAVLFSLGLFAVFAVLAPQAWVRLPLLVLGVMVAALAFSAIGTLLATLTRDARTATLVGLLLVLPIVPLGLLSGNAIADGISALLPFEHSQALFNSILFENDPWREIAVRSAALAAISLVAGVASLRLLRRLS